MTDYDDILIVWEVEDKEEIKNIMENIKYFKKRMELHLFNAKMKKHLQDIICDLETLKSMKIQQYKERYYGKTDVHAGGNSHN